MKTILLFQYFLAQDPIRRNEIESAITHNINLGFDEIIIFNDSVKPNFVGPNITNILTDSRMTFKDFIEVVNDPRNHDSLITLTNTDIKLDHKILCIDKVISKSKVFCISRHELNGQLTENPHYCQDTWAMISQPLPKYILFSSNIPIGTSGCEQRFAELLFSFNFLISNPCVDIHNIHIHSNHPGTNETDRIYGAYLSIPPSGLNGDDSKIPSPSLHYWRKQHAPVSVAGERATRDHIDYQQLRQELELLQRSWTWRIGRVATAPARLLRRWTRMP